MTAIMESPTNAPVLGIKSLELEITGKCQLTCTHCLSESSPQATHGSMTPADWRAVITDAAELGIRTIQLIGGCSRGRGVPRRSCCFSCGRRGPAVLP